MNPQDAIGPVQASIQESARVAARRRLLRGSFGVPAVLTLSSGAALAGTSSPVRCFENADPNPNASESLKTEFAVMNASQILKGGMILGSAVKADDIRIAASAGGTWVKLPAGFPAVGAGAWISVDTFSMVGLGDGVTIGTETSSSVALRFTLDNPGVTPPVFTVSGLVPVGSAALVSTSNVGKIITKSCWTSFKPK